MAEQILGIDILSVLGKTHLTFCYFDSAIKMTNLSPYMFQTIEETI